MWFNTLPNDALQVTHCGIPHIYTVEEQQQAWSGSRAARDGQP